jgi:eukaryotic-like serine/threonine-protein kinase
MTLSPGTKLGPYEIVALLGAGGMGEVYRARDTRLERTVAIKILPAQFSSDPVRKQRFEREAKAVSSLNHPHICTLHDVGSQDGISYLVMECVEGETLAKRLEKGPLPLDQVLKFGTQIADALDTAHRNGVVHRDLKPGNIMLTPTGAKLLDFGLAKPAVPLASVATLTAAVTQSSPMTEQGAIVGTFQYMSPEQVEGKELDGRSDIFSVGAVLYEMVTGQRAFQGKSQLSVASAILEKEPAPISTIKPLAPPALDHTIRRCLTKEPERRWQSVGDVARELEWVAEGETEAAKNGLQARRKAPALVFAALPVFLVLLGVFGVVYLRRPAPIGGTVRAAILPPEDAEFFALNIEGGAPAVSPDGKLLASSVRDKKGTVQLWVRAVDSPDARLLPGTKGAGHPFWSPDSRSIGFFAEGNLKRIDVDGTSLQTICGASSSPRGGSWSRDGVMLFAPSVAGPLLRVPANGGTPTTASELDAKHTESSHRWPQFLPDGKHYVFFLRNFDREQTGIYEGTLDSKEHHLVLRTGYRAVYVPPGYLLYMREQTLMAQTFDAQRSELRGEPVPLPDRVAFVSTNSDAMFSASDNGVLAYCPRLSAAMGWELAWYDRAGKKLTSIGRDFFGQPAASPDGSKVAVAIYDKEWWTPDLWVLDLARGTKTRLTFGPGTAFNPVWEPDGQALIFGSVQNGQKHIFRKSLTGSGVPEVILQTEGMIDSPGSICRDGHYLAYSRAESKKLKFGVWILPLIGDRKPFPLVEEQFDAIDPRISPDCKWVAYWSDEPGQAQIYITSFPDGKRRYQATTVGGENPRWRADSKELFFTLPDGNLAAVSVAEAGQELKLGSPHVLFMAHGIANRLGPYDARFDGQRFIVSGSDEPISQAPLTLVVNWDAGLKK